MSVRERKHSMTVPEHQKREEEDKLEALRCSAMKGRDAYARGKYSVIEDHDALDEFFDELRTKPIRAKRDDRFEGVNTKHIRRHEGSSDDSQ